MPRRITGRANWPSSAYRADTYLIRSGVLKSALEGPPGTTAGLGGAGTRSQRLLDILFEPGVARWASERVMVR